MVPSVAGAVVATLQDTAVTYTELRGTVYCSFTSYILLQYLWKVKPSDCEQKK